MSVFLKACRGEPTPYTPIWLMRQAGRYQPEYRAIRAKVSFVELCKTPDLAAEVTLLPVTQLGVDAAILFADILLILEPLGIGFEFTKGDGPHIEKPVRTLKDIDDVASEIHAEQSLGYVMDTVRRVRKGLNGSVPLIGFSGAPFTLASYAIEGGGSKDYIHTKKLMYSDEGAWNALLEKLTTACIDYLNAQVKNGAEALQVFDSWVGCLSPADYARYVKPHMTRLFAALDKSVPHIHFGTGTATLLQHQKEAGGDVIGFDWRVELGPTWEKLGARAVQGNLEPYSLLAPREELKRRASAVLA
jgi:uroporphyrinogen decarboxylase